MYLVHCFLLSFLVILQIHWITFTYGLLNEQDLLFKPTLVAVDKTTGDVYAAGSIYLARLTSNLTLISQIQTSSCESCEIRVLEIDYKTRKLLVCGVTEKGSCTYHHLDNISKFKLLNNSPKDGGDNIGRNGSVVALFLPPSQGKHSELVMGISQPLETQIDLLSFRKITSKGLTYSAGSNVKLRISEKFKRDVKVHFIYGFQFNNGSYFLVNKRGNNGTSSWIFRILYNETSVYPFVAIPLSCQYHYPEGIQYGQKYNLAIAATFFNSSLVVSFGYNSNKEIHIPDSRFGSSICTFGMEDITRDMDFVSTQHCGIHPIISTSEWIKGHGTVGYRDNTNSSCKPGYNNALEATEETSDFNPIKTEDKKLITSVISFTVDNQLHIIISTNHGDLSYRKNTAPWFKIPNNGNKKGFLADVAINTNDMTAYTITEKKIVKLSLDYCQTYLDCKSCVLNDMFNCVWFKGHCVATGRNTGGLESTCPPEITSIFPNHGLISRNNSITIRGNYLGKSVRAYRSVTVCTVTCIVNATLSNTSQIVCKTERTSKEENCPVTVEINDTVSSPHMKGSVTSGDNPKLYFHFKSVSITSFNPELGPESGGTNISVIGENLNLTKSVQIKIKDSRLPCKIISSNDTILRCTTQSLKQSPQNRNTNESIGCGQLLLMIRNDVIAETNGTFCYWNDPQITNVHPRKSIKSGGLDVNVKGTNLDVIANPRFGMTLDNSEVQPEAEECKARTSTTMICKTPKLTSLVPNDTSISGDIYFLMDGVQELKDFAKHHPNLSEIKVNPDPEFSSISDGGLVDSLKNTLRIKGTNIKESEVDNEDIQVTITSDAGTSITCPVTKLGEEAVSCAPNLISNVNETHFVVQVKVGNRYYKVGNIFVIAKGNRGLGLPESPKKITQYIIIGSVCGVVLIILIACLMWCCCRKTNKDKIRHIEMSETGDSHLVISGVQQVKRLMDAETIMKIEKANLFINREKLTIGEVIGAGNFGCVCEGILVDEDNIEIKVAIKTLQDANAGEINLKEFVEEALLMKDFEHSNVLKLIGITLSKDSLPLVILPFMGNGDLLKFVADEEREITLIQMIKFAIDISRGMEYLGSLKFVHRDLAARNCMLDDHYHVKVADFGLSRDIYEKGYYHSENKKTKLPIRWMAIESIERGTYSLKSDVWSLAVVIWELLTRGVTPYPGVEGWDIIAYLRSGRRLRKPWFCEDVLFSLMLNCWNKDIDARPNFADVTEQLIEILHHYEETSNGFTTDTFGKSVPNPPTYVTIPECYNYYESLSPRTVETQQYFVLESNNTYL